MADLARMFVVVTRTEGFSALTSICGSLGALHCVVPTFHASWPTVQRLAESAFGFCCCTAAGLAVTGVAESSGPLPVAL